MQNSEHVCHARNAVILVELGNKAKTIFQAQFLIEVSMTTKLPTILIRGQGRSVEADFHPTDEFLVATDLQNDQLVSIECKSGEQIHCGTIGQNVMKVAFTLSGNFLIAGHENHLSFWEYLGQGQMACIGRAKDPSELVLSYENLTFVENDNVWIFDTLQWLLWSIRECKPLRSLEVAPHEHVLWSGKDDVGELIAVTYDEYLTNHSQHTLSIFRLRDGQLLGEIPFAEWTDVLLSPNGKLAACQHDKERVDVWDLRQCSLTHSITNIPLYWSEFCGDSKSIFTSQLIDGVAPVQLTNVMTQEQTEATDRFPFPPNVVVSPNSNLLAIYANDRRHPIDCTQFLDVDSINFVAESTGHVGNGLFSPCGKWFASTGERTEDMEQWTTNPQPGGTIRITRLDF